MEQLRIELSQDKQWQHKIYGLNGENLHTSETYTRKHDAERGWLDLLDASLIASFERNELIDALERTGLLVKLRGAL